MNVIFDPRKEQRNIAKHGLDFSLAKAVFESHLARKIYDKFENGEHRYHVFGFAGPTNRLILVVYSFPDPDDDETIRIISLRKATRAERQQYETTLE